MVQCHQWKAVVHWPSAVWCTCCYWTMYPKKTFQPIRICLMHMQIHGMTVGRVSVRWTQYHLAQCVNCNLGIYSGTHFCCNHCNMIMGRWGGGKVWSWWVSFRQSYFGRAIASCACSRCGVGGGPACLFLFLMYPIAFPTLLALERGLDMTTVNHNSVNLSIWSWLNLQNFMTAFKISLWPLSWKSIKTIWMQKV